MLGCVLFHWTVAKLPETTPLKKTDSVSQQLTTANKFTPGSGTCAQLPWDLVWLGLIQGLTHAVITAQLICKVTQLCLEDKISFLLGLFCPHCHNDPEPWKVCSMCSFSSEHLAVSFFCTLSSCGFLS